MKGEYVEEHQNRDHSSNNSSRMFAKFHPQQQQQHHHHHHLNLHQPPPQQPTYQNPFQLAGAAPAHGGGRECQTSEEADSRSLSPSTKDPLTPQPISGAVSQPPSSAGNDGATIEVVRRPRGRPPGSKNKPRPPVIITRESEPAMSPYILEIPCGLDIIESISRFCRKRNMGLCVLNGSGTVTNVTLRQPSTTPGSTVTFHGRFDVLSISATIGAPNSNFPSNGFTISLAGPQGQVVGGAVVGPLLSAGTVYLISASFNNPTFHRLPIEDEAGVMNSGSGGGGEEGGGGRRSPQTAVSGGDSGHPPAVATPESISMYNSCHLPSDVIWAPTARQPPPPPPPY